MANPVCTRALLTEDVGNGQSAFNRKQYQWAVIYTKVLQLAAIGGTDYTNALTTTLIDDAVTLARTMTPGDRRIAWLNIYRNAALNNGAPLPNGQSGYTDAIKCCPMSFSDPEAVLMLLECKLGKRATYPQ